MYVFLLIVAQADNALVLVITGAGMDMLSVGCRV